MFSCLLSFVAPHKCVGISFFPVYSLVIFCFHVSSTSSLSSFPRRTRRGRRERERERAACIRFVVEKKYLIEKRNTRAEAEKEKEGKRREKKKSTSKRIEEIRSHKMVVCACAHAHSLALTHTCPPGSMKPLPKRTTIDGWCCTHHFDLSRIVTHISYANLV